MPPQAIVPHAAWSLASDETPYDLRAFVSTPDGPRELALEGALLKLDDGGRAQVVADGSHSPMYGAAWDGRAVVAVGGDGLILREVAGSWWEVPTPTRATLHAVAVQRELEVAVGDGGTIIMKPGRDASWRLAESPTTASLNAITVAGDGFVAVGDGGTVVRWSPRQAEWTLEPSGSLQSLHGVYWQNGAAYAVGLGGTVLRRADAVGAWVIETSGTSRDLHAVSGDRSARSSPSASAASFSARAAPAFGCAKRGPRAVDLHAIGDLGGEVAAIASDGTIARR